MVVPDYVPTILQNPQYHQFAEQIIYVYVVKWGRVNIDILSGSISPDHIHLLISVPPSISLSKAIQYIKGKSSKKLLQEFEVLQKKYWGQHLWGVFCSHSRKCE